MEQKSGSSRLSPKQIGCGAAFITAFIGICLIAAIVLLAPSVPALNQAGGAVQAITSITGYGSIVVGVIAYLWQRTGGDERV